MPGLVAAEGARSVALNLLSTAEARQLLIFRLGQDRITAEPVATDEIIAHCARLPLALAVVAARAATHPRFPLAGLAAELRDAKGGLHAFDSTDTATYVRAVFSSSYRILSTDAARVFRLLGLHAGPDVSAAAAAALAGVPSGELSPLLAELTRVHLITEHVPGRYASHDLLRAYANELAHIHDPEVERRAALRRLLDHYLHTAHAAALLLSPQRDPLTLACAQPGVTPENLSDHTHAQNWFIAEHPVLLAAIAQAADTGLVTHTWQLAWTLTDFLDRRGHWDDWAAIQLTALEATRRLADMPGEAYVHRALARGYTRLGRYHDVHTHYRQALDLYGQLGDQPGQAEAHIGLSWICERENRYTEALHHAQQALELFRATGHRAGQARALNATGWIHAQLGDHQQALIWCQEALTAHQELGHRSGEAASWDSLGYAHLQLGHHQQAAACYRHVLILHRETGDRYHEADALTNLGDSHHAAANFEAARHAWLQALDIFNELGHPNANHVRAKLQLV
jgi:tetratricopeptide (TPR) repeat protein